MIYVLRYQIFKDKKYFMQMYIKYLKKIEEFENFVIKNILIFEIVFFNYFTYLVVGYASAGFFACQDCGGETTRYDTSKKMKLGNFFITKSNKLLSLQLFKKQYEQCVSN